jgi:hypothetical protein
VVDAAAAFASVMGDPFFSANVTIEGSGSLGTESTSVTGTLDLAWRSSHLTRTATTGRTASTIEVINAAGMFYSNTGGLWFATSRDAGANVADALAQTIVARNGIVKDAGTDTIGGRVLHHLVITPPPSLQGALAVTAKGVTGFSGTMDAWVDDSGTPVLMRLAAEWDQPSGKRSVHGTHGIDLVFSNVGSDVAIGEPDQLWTWAKSKKYAYRLAYPDDWQFEKASKKYVDAYWGYDGDVVFGERFKSYGYKLNQLVSIVTKYLEQRAGSKIKFTSNKPGKLGSYPARILLYNGQFKKEHYWYVGYVAVSNGWVYWIELRTDQKTKADDKALAAQFASTFRLK